MILHPIYSLGPGDNIGIRRSQQGGLGSLPRPPDQIFPAGFGGPGKEKHTDLFRANVEDFCSKVGEGIICTG